MPENDFFEKLTDDELSLFRSFTNDNDFQPTLQDTSTDPLISFEPLVPEVPDHLEYGWITDPAFSVPGDSMDRSNIYSLPQSSPITDSQYTFSSPQSTPISNSVSPPLSIQPKSSQLPVCEVITPTKRGREAGTSRKKRRAELSDEELAETRVRNKAAAARCRKNKSDALQKAQELAKFWQQKYEALERARCCGCGSSIQL